MKFKDILVPLVLAIITTFLINHFILKRQLTDVAQTAAVGGRMMAPTDVKSIKPLNFEIDFVDSEKKPAKAHLEEVETDLARYVFSDFGASLDRLELKKAGVEKTELMGTIFPSVPEDREQKCFLVAFNEKTPYYYKFIGRKDLDETIELEYKASSDVAEITKKFVVSKKTHKVDLLLNVTPKGDSDSVETRVLFPSPFFPKIQADDDYNVLVSEDFGKITEKKHSDEEWRRAFWLNAKFFGFSERYFVHAFIDEESTFVNRAFCNAITPKKFVSFLDGAVEKNIPAKLSFYFGPKEADALVAVSPFLGKILEQHWYSWPAKATLWVLNKINDYSNNYGWAIIALAFLIQLIMWPFNPQDERKMKKQAEFRKKLEYIKRKYKDQPEVYAAKQKELMKKNGVLGGMGGGCVMMLFQIPFFFGLRFVLRNSIELYNATFVPHWITNLADVDPLYVLPVVTCVAMLVRAMTMDKKQRFMGVSMALMGGAFFASFSAGLCLYILVSTVFGFAQTKIQKLFSK